RTRSKVRPTAPSTTPFRACRRRPRGRLRRSGGGDVGGRSFRELVAQPRKAGEHPALDRPDRLAEPLGELGLRVPAEVRELDRLALLGRQYTERRADRIPSRQVLGLVGGARVDGFMLRLERLCAPPLLATDEVDRAP